MKSGILLLHHIPWFMGLHKRHDLVLITVWQAGDSTLCPVIGSDAFFLFLFSFFFLVLHRLYALD